MPAAFLTTNAHADAVSRAASPERLERPIDATPQETLSDEEFDRRLAVVNARFDARRPRRLKVRVKRYGSHELAVAISDAGRPARRLLGHVYAGNHPLAVVLAKARVLVASKVADFYNEDSSRWFMRTYGEVLLSPDRFDPRTGFNVCVRLPTSAEPPPP